MKLRWLNQPFTVAKTAELPAFPAGGELVCLARTNEEISLVCETRFCPPDCQSRKDGWRAFCIEGVLDFSLVGILSRISSSLSEAGIPIFAVSTFNTDYVLIQEKFMNAARISLEQTGFAFNDDCP